MLDGLCPVGPPGPVIRAGMAAADCGQPRLNDGFLLLALAEGEPLARPVELGVTASRIRAAIEARSPRRRDRELLATLGIDLDEVRRRAVVATRSDDPGPVAAAALPGPPAARHPQRPGHRDRARRGRPEGHRGRPVGQPPRPPDPGRTRGPALGLLADGSSESVRILRRGGADIGRLWADLRRWHRSGDRG